MINNELKNRKPNIKAKVVLYDDTVPSFYQTFKYGKGNILSTLENDVSEWSYCTPVLIDAPTGRGKTTFVYEKLIPSAVTEGKNLLLLSNRTALSTQQKKTIMEKINSPLLGRLTDQGIRETEDFGQVRVLTYHRLPAFINDPANAGWIAKLKYVVADEAHFFVNDAEFNHFCGLYLKLITKKFRHAIRIYMSATTNDVLHPLANAELQLKKEIPHLGYPRYSNSVFYRYVFDPDYSHVNLKFFNDLAEIQHLVNQSSDQKWLVFIDSKEKGREFAKQLGSKALYLDASSKTSKDWVDLLDKCKFQEQVLITTKVADCGINILDNELRNVCVMTDSQTSLIQMLGRKRCNPGEKVNLYVYNIPDQTIRRRHEVLTEMNNLYNDYCSSTDAGRNKLAQKLWIRCNPQEHHYFYLTEDSSLAPNELAFYALQRKLRFYKQLLSNQITFHQAVQSWLGRSPADVDNIGTEESQAQSPQALLTAFCEAHLDQELTEQEIVAFRSMVINAAEHAGYKEPRKDRLDTLGQKALNNRLGQIKIPYRTDTNHWIIKKVET